QPWQGEAVLVLRFSPNYLVDHLVRVVTARATATGHYKLTLWQSTVPAHSWIAVATLETEIPSVLIAQPAGEQTNRLFLATGHRLITFSTAADPNEWAVQQHFFFNYLRVTALALSPTFAADQTLFAATTQGVFVSRDGGERWSQHAGNPQELPIVALLPARDSQLRAVTLGGEVWFQHTYAND
ncbi:MAG: hypothetical protein KDE19_21450, partial [Caldilineaceae bacterium]|nr:hypothetical protein [Caldilineaceae bacterium]